MELGDRTNETIPEGLIVRAAMLAASGLIGASAAAAKSSACGSIACGFRCETA
jgi:hypothetical protein